MQVILELVPVSARRLGQIRAQLRGVRRPQTSSVESIAKLVGRALADEG